MKNKLQNQLTKNLGLTMAFKLQNFFMIENFFYYNAYESSGDATKR
jgi:hypothetical protein